MPEQLSWLLPWLHLAGRVLFGLFFLIFGLIHLLDTGAAARYLERKGIAGPKPAAVASGLMLLVGGVLVVLGWHRFIGAGLLFLVLLPGAFALHPFWHEGDPAKRRASAAQFLMMLGLAGAALVIAVHGGQSWPFSLGG